MTGKHFQRLTILALATGASFLAASAAQAGYSVQTVANTGRGYNRGCAATYNYIGNGAQFILNDGSHAPCPTEPFNGQTVSVSGTTDTTGTATAAHDESSVTAPPDGAYATAAADLATAQIHLTASAAGFSSANATAQLQDVLHFTIAGASADTVTLIPISFAFDGKFVGASDPATASAELNYGFYFGNAAAYEFGDYGAGYYGSGYPTFAYAGAATVQGWDSASFSSYDPLNTQFTGYYAITGATADIPIDFSLGINVTNVALDYSHTGTITIGQVAGVSYTSDSGVFPSAVAPGAVPEPATWGMLIIGFGATGTMLRRRRIVRAAA